MNEVDKTTQKSKLLNLTLAVVAGQVGFVTLVIIIGAIFLGLWLDNRFQTQHLYTIIALVASVPISLLVMLLIVRAAVARIKTRVDEQKQTSEEETNIGKDA